MEDSVFNKNIKKLPYSKTDIIVLIILSIFLIFVLFIRNISKKYSNVNIKDIKISVDNNQIGISKEKLVNIKITPEGANTSNLKWNISNPNILDIDGNKMIGKELGKTTIFLEDDKVKSNEIEISCVTYISEAKIKNPIDKLSAFKEYKLDIDVFPEEAMNKDYVLVSSNPEIVEIRDKNVLYGKNTGKSVIYVKDTFGKVLAEMEIEVIWIKIKNIDIDEKELKLGVGQKSILYAKIEPLNATNIGIVWESENPDIASIDQNGIITGKKPGIVKIQAKVKNEEKKSECFISVTEGKQLGKFLYASGIYPIKYEPLFQAKTQQNSKFWELIEFLGPMEKEGWIKIRNSEGLPGFIEYRANRFLKDKPKLIEKVRYISNKDINMENGSLIASAMMILENKGYTVSSYNLLYSLPKVSNIIHTDNKYFAGDPYEKFIGNPESKKEEGSYTGFTKPTIDMIRYQLGNIYEDVSGKSEEEIINYIDKEIPILVWINSDAERFKNGISWNMKDGTYTPKENIAVGVIVGYDKDNLYIHNPEKNAYTKHNKKVFFENWRSIKSPAIIIK